MINLLLMILVFICFIISMIIGIILGLKDIRKNVDIKPFDNRDWKIRYREDNLDEKNKTI